MWSTEGKTRGIANIYENHSTETVQVTALVHNEEAEKEIHVTVPPSNSRIRLGSGESMAFTAIIETGRAITSEGKCRFSVTIHR